MWKRIGSFIFLGIYFTGFAVFALAGDEKVSVSVSRKEILLGDSVVLTITVEGLDNPQTPELPEISDFDVKFRGARQASFSNMTIIVNGRRIKNEQSGGEYKFDFELIPKSTGLFTVPGLPILINGKRYTTQSFQVNVLEQSEKRGDIFINVDVDKTEAYLGEKILVTFKWYFSKDIGNYRINIPWLESVKNFLVTDPEPDKDLSYQRLIVNGDKRIAAVKSREFYKGREYMVVSSRKLLTPIAAGVYTLEPVFLKCDVVTGYKRSDRNRFGSFFDSGFDSFFGFGRNAVTEPFATRSNEIVLNINEVPARDRPAEYNGAVGRFTFDVDVKPLSLKVGEPVTLTMKVAGSGNFEQLKLPHIPDMESFKSYEPESKVNVFQEGGEIRGEKIFEEVLIPRSAGDYEIPGITFVFFNPATGVYQTEVRGPFIIHVAKAEKEEEVKVIAIDADGGEDNRRRELKVLKRDIRYIMKDIGKTITLRKPVYENVGVWIPSFSIPVIMLAGMFVFGRRRKRLDNDVAFARSRAALNNSKRFFKLAETALRKGEARDFYDSLMKGLNNYLADKLNRPVGSVNIAVVDELKPKGLGEKECSGLKDLYRHSSEVIFSSLPVSADKLKRDFKTANDIVARLERILR